MGLCPWFSEYLAYVIFSVFHTLVGFGVLSCSAIWEGALSSYTDRACFLESN